MSKGAFRLNASSLSVGFQRFERDGLIRNEWKATENSRRAKYYALTERDERGSTAKHENGESKWLPIARILEVP
jgi:PadR family transcriptional regulator PadR